MSDESRERKLHVGSLPTYMQDAENRQRPREKYLQNIVPGIASALVDKEYTQKELDNMATQAYRLADCMAEIELETRKKAYNNRY